MKKNMFLGLIFGIALLFLIGCSKYNDSVTNACNNTIKELNYYINGKEDIKELEYNIRSYAEDCKPSEDNISETNICVSISNVATQAYNSYYFGKKDLVKFEEEMNNLKELCR